MALSEDGHTSKIYDMTGPDLQTMAEALDIIAQASGRALDYVQISHEALVAGLEEQGTPPVLVSLYHYLFTTVLDGPNAHIINGVEDVLRRKPGGFATYAQNAAAAGAWL
jgi:uncharacterized protein YbjT (DUF2867 family)